MPISSSILDKVGTNKKFKNAALASLNFEL